MPGKVAIASNMTQPASKTRARNPKMRKTAARLK
jgi:hypothetical protein